jgi:dCMP deaminase
MAEWYGRMMQVAELSASWSKDTSRGVGCVVFNPETHGVLAQGFNGFARGVDENIPERHERPAKYKYTVHAEINGIAHCAKNGIRTQGMSMAVTFFPCAPCANAAIQAGICKLVVPDTDFDDERWGADFKESLKILTEAGVEIIYLVPVTVAEDKSMPNSQISGRMLIPVTEWKENWCYKEGDQVRYLGVPFRCLRNNGHGWRPGGNTSVWEEIGKPPAASEKWIKEKIYYHKDRVTYMGRVFEARLGSNNHFYPDLFPNIWTQIAGDPVDLVHEWDPAVNYGLDVVVQYSGKKYVSSVHYWGRGFDPHTAHNAWAVWTDK